MYNSSTCDVTEFMNEEYSVFFVVWLNRQESIQEGVIFVSCVDLLLHHEQKEGSRYDWINRLIE